MVERSAGEVAYGRLTGGLRRGIYAPGSRLPGERGLAEQLGVSRATLRQALVRLADEGLLERSAQRGWFVPEKVVGTPPSVLQSFTEMARARGLRPTSRILDVRERQASLDEAELLGIAPAAPVLRVYRLRGMNEIPICLDDAVLIAERARALADVDLTDRSLYQALEETCGIVVARSAYTLQALIAGPEQADLLGLAANAPVLVGQEVTYDTAGLPVLISRTTYRGDAYRFQADLYRPGV
ncbi:GntR family transcriptional regulator [Kribbella sp. NPDC002412]